MAIRVIPDCSSRAAIAQQLLQLSDAELGHTEGIKVGGSTLVKACLLWARYDRCAGCLALRGGAAATAQAHRPACCWLHRKGVAESACAGKWEQHNSSKKLFAMP